jgi:(1->4)-alpha-D-glucan 1-alpha-D-glucosylmutase
MPATPTATYRLQFNPDFGFRDAIALIPYLDQLGISHVYASPLLAPAPGSTHGYDVVDPTNLNPELGEESDFQELLSELSGRGMGLILDIVPNHMAVNSANRWWQDALEHGQYSRFAHFFDIDWDQAHGRIVLPTLGDHIGTILDNGELALGIGESGLAINYYENKFPVDPASYSVVLNKVQQAYLQELGDDDDASFAELRTLLSLSRDLNERAGHPDELQRVAAGFGQRTWNLYRSDKRVQASFDMTLESFNRAPYTQLERLLDDQHYRLTFWRRASEDINYRRFFDIGDLISLRIEDPEVFEAVHALILEYAGTSGLDGFRADHFDGLFDPESYATRLHERLAEATGRDTSDFLLLFEKILTGDEQLPPDWQISGATGYEFAHRINAILADSDGFEHIERHFAELTGLDQGFESVVHANKAMVLDDLFSGQFQMLVNGLMDLAGRDRHSRDISRRQLADALREVMVLLPVYRTYVRDNGGEQRDRQLLQDTLNEARENLPKVEAPVWALLERVFLSDDADQAHRDWVRRWQQFTGPLMAKGLEDTALYVYTPLSSLNEVGGEPETMTSNRLHSHNSHVARHWPRSMLSTSTHDTKRSEDVRARISVLSELAREWIDHLDEWRRLNADLRENVGGIAVPDPNEEQLIYQTLLGSWPLDRSELSTYRERVKEYFVKAMREAKVHTHWIAVNEEHEQAVLRFIDRLFESDPTGRFFQSFLAFQTRLSSFGAWNSLAQLVLKLTSPGFPDIYQGQELWDYSLADPDNRRPVDYDRRKSVLDDTRHIEPEALPSLCDQWRDGRIKMLVTSRILRDRRESPEPFATGEYLALVAEGSHADNVVAFARRQDQEWVLTVVPRHTTQLVGPDQAPVGADVWRDTRVQLPQWAPSTWVDAIHGEQVQSADGEWLNLSDVLTHLPVAVLRASG